MAEMAWPEDLGHGTFTGRFGWMDADGVDEGTDPDITAASGGTVEITPAVTTVRYTGAAGPLSLVARRAVGIIDYEGYLCTKNADGTAGPRGMPFPATDNDALSPSGWTYRVSVKLPGGITLPSFSTTLATGAVVDLATAIPVDASPGVVKVVDETIAVRAEAAATRAEAAADAAEEWTPSFEWDGTHLVVDGVPGPDLKGDPGEGGGGIREVEGPVQLPTDGPRVLEIYTVGDTTIGPETFPVDTAVVARRRADGVWERWVVGADSGWREFGASTPDPPRSVTPDAPEFVDRSGTAQDVTIIPAVTGVQYLIDGAPVASGSHPSSGTVTVDAIAADESVTIVGTASWTHIFSEEMVQEWGTRAHRATFTAPDTGSVGIYHDPTRPTEFPPVYTDESGGVWNGRAYNTHIRSGALQFTANGFYAWVEHGQPGDVSVRATVTNGTDGRIYAQMNGPLENTNPLGIHMTFKAGVISLSTLVNSTSYNKGGGTGTTALIPDYDPATPYRLRFDVVGDQAMVFVDDVHYMTGTILPSRIAEAGGRRLLGLAAMTNGVTVDDVEVWVP